MSGEIKQGYLFEPIKRCDAFIPKKGSFILLVGVNLIPPHLMLMVDGKIFDWSVKGIRSGVLAEPLLNKLLVKGKQILAVETSPLKTTVCREIFNKNNDQSYSTCLGGIQAVFNEEYSLSFDENDALIFDVLKKLKEENLILAYHSWNIGTIESYFLPLYSIDDVMKNIKRYQHNDGR